MVDASRVWVSRSYPADDIAAFARSLADAEAVNIPVAFPRARMPADKKAARLVQQAAFALAFKPILGWKVAHHPEHGPVAAPITRVAVAASRSTHFDFSRAEGLEVEIAFLLGRDLRASSDATVDTVLDAVRSIHVGVEFVGHRLSVPDRSHFPAFLADRLGNDGYVLGPAIEENLLLRLVADGRDHRTLTVRIDGRVAYAGAALHPDRDPRKPLADFLRDHAESLAPEDFWSFKAGHFITTGSVCGLVPLSGNQEISIDWLQELKIVFPT